jgi:ribose transport system substrate-binding protein
MTAADSRHRAAPMTSKPLRRLGFLALLALSLGAPGMSAFAAKARKIALVQVNQQARFFMQINEGAVRAAKDAGAELVIFNANNSPSAQNDAIETYINDKVDAIVVCAIDVNGIKPAISMAKRAGIPVVALDAIVNGDNDVQVGVDSKKAGEDMGRFAAQYLRQSLGGKADVGVVGALNSFIQNMRLDGFKAGLKEGAPQALIVNTVDGRNAQDAAQGAAENLLTANPKMKVIYATGEPALIGSLAAALSQNATGRVKVFGWDLTAQAIKGIDEGWVVGVVQQDAYGIGKAGVESALKLLDKGAVPKQVMVPVTIVTKDNVSQYRSIFK